MSCKIKHRNQTRPTLDKVREAVFHPRRVFDGGTVLDLYADSGANGLEALVDIIMQYLQLSLKIQLMSSRKNITL